ncbi:MAG: type II secretion system minor pseudopilin GspH [Gammaproteobacteria bacterium]|nr:type II secretion system minor pseudopilin GspH [Gammaproteobacteria bacterium]
MRQCSRGFTLLELLAVVAIIAILASMAVVNLNFGGDSETLRKEGERLRELMRLAGDEATFQSRQLGIRFNDGSYRFLLLEGSYTESQWTNLSGDKRLRRRVLPEGIELTVEVSGVPILLSSEEEDAQSETPLKPQLIFLSNGERMPDVSVVLRLLDRDVAVRLEEDENAVLKLIEQAF